MPQAPLIVAAGAVVARKSREVLLVHRPKYLDWSFPKGKVDPGEHVVATAVREVAEESGLDIRLGPPLSPQTYSVGDRDKMVHYWAGRLTGGDDVSAFVPNDEIDQVEWLPVEDARERLSYDYDRETLVEFEKLRKKTFALVVLRHARAVPRGAWKDDDRERRLTGAGGFQAEQLVPMLAAYGVERVVSSSSRRCWTTVAPYAEVADLDIEETKALSEEDATAESVRTQVQVLLGTKESAALCTHRPVLPFVWEALGIPGLELDRGGMAVVHHRRGRVVAVEEHDSAFR